MKFVHVNVLQDERVCHIWQQQQQQQQMCANLSENRTICLLLHRTPSIHMNVESYGSI